jgi:hypothetical protein
MPRRCSSGRTSRSISMNLLCMSPAWLVTPVMLPPGRAIDATNPLSTACEMLTTTIGTERVARRAASIAPVLVHRMTSGCAASSSVASAASRSGRPSL